MKRLAVACVIAAGCSTGDTSALEARIRKLERAAIPDGNERVAWCPTDGDDFCSWEHRSQPKEFAEETPLGEWVLNASKIAAELCIRRAGEIGAGCVETRLVVCATQDPTANICFLRWHACEKKIAAFARAKPENPRGRCVAYFDGKPLEQR